MEKLIPPPHLQFEGNVAENWRKWKQQFQLYILATEYNKKEENLQCALLLHCIGEDGIEIFNTFTFLEAEKDKIAPLLQKFESYCIPLKNVTHDRHKFFTYSQGPGETIDQYVTELKTKAKKCEFGNLMDSLIRDRIICGIKSDALRERLLREQDLSLKKAVDMCRAAEISKEQVKVITEEEKSIQFVKKDGKKKKQHQQIQAKGPNPGKFRCKKCGTEHSPRNCPAYGKICHKCKKSNHFKKMCRTKRMHTIHEEDESTDEDDFYIGSLTRKSDTDTWTTKLNVSGKCINFKLDTGAQANVIPYNVFKSLRCNTKLRATNSKLITYSGEKMNVLGKCNLNVQHNGNVENMDFSVVHFNAPCILGLKACEQLNLITRVMKVNITSDSIIEEYKDVFEGIGCLEGEYHIQIDKSVSPVIHPPRRVPIAIRDKLKQELDRMEKLGIVEKVDCPTEWVSSMVIVEKSNGNLRICLDPKDLNKAIMREHFQLPTQEEITSKLAGAKYFSKLDASSGFWQLKIDSESSMLCTFNTPYGRYKFLRLPFGVTCASEIFHKATCKILDGLDGVQSFIDDILVYGSTKEEHDRNLRQVLDRIQESNMKLNREKCEIGITEVTYFGHRYTQNGLKLDDNKIKAVVDMQVPKNRKDLERFMGMVTYIAKFVPNFSSRTSILRDLLKKNVEWHWDSNHDAAYNDLKKLVTNAPVLRYFNKDLPVKLSVDSSKDGLGAVLLQKELPVEYASRALTDTQKRWAQIEKELYAIVFGCEKFHQYVYGRKVEVESDHKPLEAIFKKPLVQAPPRIQRLLLKLQRYDLEIKYKPGKEMYISDTLSRSFLPDVSDTIDEEMDVQIHSLISNLPISETKLEEFKEATRSDTSLTKLKNIVQAGWPENKTEVPEIMRPYWDFREEIHEIDGLLFKGEKLIVPTTKRKEMLVRIHEGHQGIEKCKNRAREVLYWPGMSSQITDVVQKCEICQRYRKSNPKEPMFESDLPNRPWQKVATDLFEYKNKSYIVVVDYYSKFFEVNVLGNTKSETVITNLRSIFSRHGIPEIVVSDNGPQYSSHKFKIFSKEWEFEHITSSPRYPPSNGLAERTVQTIKQILKKADHQGVDPYLSILNYRNTPIDSNMSSPSQILMGRRCRTRLPISKKLLSPQEKGDNKQTNKQLEDRQRRQKFYYDKNSRKLPQFKEKENIYMRRDAVWEPAVVMKKMDNNRSYIVKAQNNVTYRRNRKHLMKNRNQVVIRDEYDSNEKNNCDNDITHETVDNGSNANASDVNQSRCETRDTSRPNNVVTKSGRVVMPPKRLIEEM